MWGLPSIIKDFISEYIYEIFSKFKLLYHSFSIMESDLGVHIVTGNIGVSLKSISNLNIKI